MSSKKTIGLCMIVKNEAHIIKRCLTSVLPLIDYILIMDTGSTDGTQAAIKSFLDEHKIEGAIIESEWVDFAHNRSLALEALRHRTGIDYGLMIDADEILVFDEKFNADKFKRTMTDDVINVVTKYDTIAYTRPQIFNNRVNFQYKGVVHEYLDCGFTVLQSTAEGFHNKPLQDGARCNDPFKFKKDATALEQALTTETDPFLRSRYTFYAAQSYKDSNELDKALFYYVERAGQGFWEEEVYISLLNVARLKELLNCPEASVLKAYIDAYEYNPKRLEALHGAVKYCRAIMNWHIGYALAMAGKDIAKPSSGLFIEDWIYDYGLMDELSLVAYYAGHYKVSYDTANRLLSNKHLPLGYRDRIKENVKFASDKLPVGTLSRYIKKPDFLS